MLSEMEVKYGAELVVSTLSLLIFHGLFRFNPVSSLKIRIFWLRISFLLFFMFCTPIKRGLSLLFKIGDC